jgi:uncharacterized membrane protein
MARHVTGIIVGSIALATSLSSCLLPRDVPIVTELK